MEEENIKIIKKHEYANIKRNDDCCCGSGKKFKKCCMLESTPLIKALIEFYQKKVGDTFAFLDVSKELKNQRNYEELQRKYWNGTATIDGKKVICIAEKNTTTKDVFKGRTSHPKSDILLFRSGVYRSFPSQYALNDCVDYGDFFDFVPTEEMQEGISKEAVKNGNVYQVGL